MQIAHQFVIIIIIIIIVATIVIKIKATIAMVAATKAK